MLLGAGWQLLAGEAAALTLGDLVVHSRPGEPLRGSIPLTLQGEEQLSRLHVTPATAEAYAQQQVHRPSFLEGLRIGLFSSDTTSARIQLFGELPWQGDEALLLLNVVWPEGQLSRGFHIAGVSPEADLGRHPPRFIEVAENETLDAIAIRLSEGGNRSYLHMMYALFLANPDAFYNGNMNNLKGGARLRVPSGEELYRLKNREVFDGIHRQMEQWQQQREYSPAASKQAGAVLSGTRDAERPARELKSEPVALQQQLQQLAGENEAIQSRNEELKARLARLEQQMQRMTEQVLDYPTAGEQPAAAAAQSPASQESAAAQEPATAGSGEAGSEGLPAYILLLAMALALGAGVMVRRFALDRQGRRG
jgi:pilus assembly protein FimV